MPDRFGNFKGISVPAAAWDRIFGPKTMAETMALMRKQKQEALAEFVALARANAKP